MFLGKVVVNVWMNLYYGEGVDGIVDWVDVGLVAIREEVRRISRQDDLRPGKGQRVIDRFSILILHKNAPDKLTSWIAFFNAIIWTFLSGGAVCNKTWPKAKLAGYANQNVVTASITARPLSIYTSCSLKGAHISFISPWWARQQKGMLKTLDLPG